MNVFPWLRTLEAALPRGAYYEDTFTFTFNELIVHSYVEYSIL